MRVLNSAVISLALISATMSVAAQAGPEITVIFKNRSSAPALYSAGDANELRTKMNALPTPRDRVEPEGAERYDIKSSIGQGASFASIRYRIGAKVCQFTTSYVMSRERGVTMPKWNKKAVPSNGANCTAKITSVNYATHAWTVELSMK